VQVEVALQLLQVLADAAVRLLRQLEQTNFLVR
jgi:hypothetical protein